MSPSILEERRPLLENTRENESSSRSSNPGIQTTTAQTQTRTNKHNHKSIDNRDEEHDIITFLPSDPENPRNWPAWRKRLLITPIIIVDLAVSWGASGFSPTIPSFSSEFDIGPSIAILGLSLYILGLALGPMTLAPLSEYYGRSPLYIIPFGIYVVFLMGTAVTKGLIGVLVLRFLSGLVSGVTIANLGGTIADLWPRHEVGVAVSWWMWAAVGGSPSGYFLMSIVAQYRGWRDVFWVLAGVCGVFWLVMSVVLLAGNETRHSVLLRRRAERVRREGSHGVGSVDVPEEMKERSWGTSFRIALTRPFRLLFTEPIIVFAALYNGYLYGLSFLFNGAFGLVFGKMGYGFDVMQVGLCFLGFFIGVSIGPFTYLWQEQYYQRRIHADPPKSRQNVREGEDGYFRNIPEARLQLGKIAAITFPISLWWFAWTCMPSYGIHWIVPILATTLFGWSFYNLILMTYIYIEDSYMEFSASALAGVGLIRNLAGAGFPLFGRQMFVSVGYNWAGTILAGLAMLLIPIPFILDRYGVELRAKSPWARQAMDEFQEEEQPSLT